MDASFDVVAVKTGIGGSLSSISSIIKSVDQGLTSVLTGREEIIGVVGRCAGAVAVGAGGIGAEAGVAWVAVVAFGVVFPFLEK